MSDDINENQLYLEAILKWGIYSQTNMAIEECAELIVAIRHSSRNKATVLDVAQEVADVEIMCGQLREIIGNEIVAQCKKEKLIRLKKRLNKNA